MLNLIQHPLRGNTKASTLCGILSIPMTEIATLLPSLAMTGKSDIIAFHGEKIPLPEPVEGQPCNS